MIQLHYQTQEALGNITASREGETKIGESLLLCESLDEMTQSPAKYVIFGICEDIGVQANYGNPGTAQAWQAFITSFANVQANRFNKATDVLILGHITVTPDVKHLSLLTKKELGTIVSRIDKKVTSVVQRIVASGKIPIIIGGGHNNAYGNIKGTSQALKKAINSCNLDAHTDLRSKNYRHSGNGFTEAIQDDEGSYLDKYLIFGLHKNHTPDYIFKTIEAHNEDVERILVAFMEDMLLPEMQLQALDKALPSIANNNYGIELDCDSIANFPSSAQTPSGFSLETMRLLIKKLASSPHCSYLHICEAAPSKKTASQVGKALTYLVTDFLRNHRDHITL